MLRVTGLIGHLIAGGIEQRMRRSQICFVLFLMLYFSGEGSAAERNCIGFITGSGDHFWDEVYKGVKSAILKENYEPLYLGLNNEANALGQLHAVESFMPRRCKGLIIAPNHPDRLAQITQLQEMGVAVVFIDRGLEGVTDVPIIATDNYMAGQFAAQKMVMSLPAGASNIAVLRLAPGVNSTTQREQGFIDLMSKQGFEIVVSDYVGTTIVEVKSNSIKLLRGAKRPIHGIFTPNETTTVGVTDILPMYPASERPVLIGFDQSEWITRALEKGALNGVVAQRPVDMGGVAATMLLDFLKTGKPMQSESIDVDYVQASTPTP